METFKILFYSLQCMIEEIYIIQVVNLKIFIASRRVNLKFSINRNQQMQDDFNNRGN